jgi:hypothetical protein
MPVVKAVLQAVMNGTVNENVIHFFKDVVAWPNDGAALAADLRDNFIGGANGIRTRLISLQRWNLINVYNIDSVDSNPVALPVDIVGALTGNGSQSFAHNCILIRKRSDAGGKRGRGRMYFSGLEPSVWSNGIMTSGQQTLWLAILVNLAGRYCDPNPISGWTMVVAGKPPIGDGFHRVKRLELSSTPGVQRRRNIGVGI